MEDEAGGGVGLCYDIIKPFSDKTSGKFAIQVQFVLGCQVSHTPATSIVLHGHPPTLEAA